MKEKKKDKERPEVRDVSNRDSCFVFVTMDTRAILSLIVVQMHN